MPRELRAQISITVPIPDNGSAFDDARLVLGVEEQCSELGRYVVEADGRFLVNARVVNTSLARSKDEPEQTLPLDDESQEPA